DLSEADQSERATKQSARFRKLFLVPLTTSQCDDVVGNATIDRQYQRESKLGHGDRVFTGTIRNVNAALRSGGDVDRVVTGAGAHDQFHWSSVEHRLSHFRSSHDENIGRFLANRRNKRVVFQIRLVRDIATERLQAVPA